MSDGWTVRRLVLVAVALGLVAVGTDARATPVSSPPSAEVEEPAPPGDKRPMTSTPLGDINGAGMFAGPAPAMLGVDLGTTHRSHGLTMRWGGGVLSTVRPMPLSPGHLTIALPYATAEGCASVDDQRLVFRVCAGPMVGATFQRWHGFDRPGPRRRPWVAARMGAQYGLLMGNNAGLSLGFDFTIPIVSADYRSRGPQGQILDQRRSRPVGYMLRLGVAFRGRRSSCSRRTGCSVRPTAPAEAAP